MPHTIHLRCEILLCLAMFSGFSVATVSSHRRAAYTYDKVTPRNGVIRLGSGWQEVSALACAARTTEQYSNSRSFMYNPATHLCTPGLWLDGTEPPPSDEEGDLYVTSDAPPDCTIMTIGNTTACIGIFGPPSTYEDAKLACQNMNAFLASVKTVDKLQMLDLLSSDGDVWIGLKFKLREGTYIWEEDGSELPSASFGGLFAAGEPDYSGDCTRFRRDYKMLADMSCSKEFLFACEVNS